MIVKGGNNFVILLLPLLLLAALTTIALINYPIIFDRAKGTIILLFAGMAVYALVWHFLRPDGFSRNGGLLIGLLFLVNISMEEFIDWPAGNGSLISTLVMMALIFCSFSIISGIRTWKTGNIVQGIKSSFISALLGTAIALSYGFLIHYLFSARMVSILKNYPGYNSFSNPKAFIFFNAFDNASNHILVAPVISVIMGVVGGGVALVIRNIRGGS